MGVANTVITTLEEYQRVLNEHPVVFAFFFSNLCAACELTYPNVKTVSDRYADLVKVMILNAADTPPIKTVTGFPTLVVYKNSVEVENLKGIGYPQEQVQILEALFSQYAKNA